MNSYFLSRISSSSSSSVCSRHRLIWLFLNRRFSHSSQEEAGEDADKPVKFSTSKAGSWKAAHTFSDPRDMPPSQPYIVSLSVAVFLLYFCVLRKESDIDQRLGGSLWDSAPHLEEPLLESAVEEHKRRGLDTMQMEQRLSDIRKEKQGEAKT